MEVRAVLNKTRTAPQKARLVAQLIRGKNVNDAMNILQLTRKKGGSYYTKYFKSRLLLMQKKTIRCWTLMICL